MRRSMRGEGRRRDSPSLLVLRRHQGLDECHQFRQILLRCPLHRPIQVTPPTM
jgi:hypothetical protein